jgi:hypothetical protein
VAGQLGVQLVQHGRDAGLGVGLHVGRVGGHALGVEVVDEHGLQRVGQPHHPLVVLGPLGRAGRGAEARVAVGRVHQDGGRLVEHEVAVHQHGDQAIGVEPEVGRRLVLVVGAVHLAQPVRDAHFLEQQVRGEAGVAGVVVQFDHGVAAWRRLRRRTLRCRNAAAVHAREAAGVGKFPRLHG